MDITEQKSTISEQKRKKNSFGGINNRLDTTKERISEPEEDSAKEIIKFEAHR